MILLVMKGTNTGALGAPAIPTILLESLALTARNYPTNSWEKNKNFNLTTAADAALTLHGWHFQSQKVCTIECPYQQVACSSHLAP